MSLQQIVGLTSMMAPPSRGGVATPAHFALSSSRVLPPNVVANLNAVQAAQLANTTLAPMTVQPAMPMNYMAAPRNIQTVPLHSNGPREFPLGFGTTSVPANTTATITAQPQVIFRPSRLIIPSQVAPSFSINDFRIGKNSQLVSPASIPAVAFTEGSVGTAMSLDTCNVGQLITIEPTNNTANPVNFTAALFGTSTDS